MIDTYDLKLGMSDSAFYQIRVQGRVGESWFDYYDDMVVVVEADGADEYPITVLTGQLADQAALIGMLSVIYYMQLPLISVMPVSVLPNEGQKREDADV